MSTYSSLEKQIDSIQEGASSSKHIKQTSESRESRSTERAKEKAKPRLTIEGLRQFKTNFLPDVVNPDPDFHYMWLSRDPHAQPNYHDAVTHLGYSPCTTNDLPEMLPYVQLGKMDNSIKTNEIIVKEMILCKIHAEDYQTLMRYNHHVQPAEQEGDIYRKFNDAIRGKSNVAPLRRELFGELGGIHEDKMVSASSIKLGDGGTVSKVINPIFK